MLQLSKTTGDHLTLQSADETLSQRLPAAQQAELTAINQAYQALLAQHLGAKGQQAPLRELGVQLWNWLGALWPASRALAELPTQRFEIKIGALRNTRSGEIDPLSLLLLQAPWEILADDAGHFAQGRDTDFVVVRYLHRRTRPDPYTPADRRLSLVFMAASPLGLSVLDYDQEELAIEKKAGAMQFDLNVEERVVVILKLLPRSYKR